MIPLSLPSSWKGRATYDDFPFKLYVRRGRLDLLRLLRRTWFRRLARGVGWFAGALVLSAAAVENFPLPLSLACCAPDPGGLRCAWAAPRGAGLSYFLGKRRIPAHAWMGPTLAALLLGDWGAAADGCHGQLDRRCLRRRGKAWLKDETPLEIYLFADPPGRRRDGSLLPGACQRGPGGPVAAWGFAALALAQLNAVPALNPGLLLAGGWPLPGLFPAAAMAGLAGPGPERAGAHFGGGPSGIFARFLPKTGKYPRAAAAGVIYLMFTRVFGGELLPVVPLCLGGAFWGGYGSGTARCPPQAGGVGHCPGARKWPPGSWPMPSSFVGGGGAGHRRRGPLMQRLGERSCGNCPCRKPCPVRESIENWTRGF